MPEPILTSIIAALVAGATAQAGKVASQAVADAYEGLKKLVVDKLGGKKGAVQSIEDEPNSKPAQAALAETLANNGLQADAELKKLADQVESAIAEAKAAGAPEAGSLDFGKVVGEVNATVEDLVAKGSIRFGDVTAARGDAVVRGLRAGVTASAQGAGPKNG